MKTIYFIGIKFRIAVLNVRIRESLERKKSLNPPDVKPSTFSSWIDTNKMRTAFK